VPFLLISLLTLLIFVLLFTFRATDDNRLTSWQWVFDGGRAAGVFFALFAGVSLALFIKVPFTLRFPSVVLFILSFISAAFFWVEPEVIVDASRYFTQAKHLEIYGTGYFFREWGKTVQAWTDLPLVPFLYGIIFRFIGESRLYIQVLNTCFFSMTVVLTCLTGKELWDEDAGMMGGAFLLGMPYLLTQVPLMLVDVPAMFFLTLSIYMFIIGLKRGGWMIPVSSFSILFAFLSKYSTWPMLTVLTVIFIVCLKEASEASHGKTVLSRGLSITCFALLMAGAVILWRHEIFSEQIRLLLQFQKPGLRKWGEGFTSTFFFQIHPFVTLSALFSFYVAFTKKDLRYAIISWLVVLLVAFQLKRIRYSLPLFPMIALMASYGLQYLKDKEIRKFVVLCAVISSLSVSLFGYLPFLQRISAVNIKKAGQFLNTAAGEMVEVFVLPEKEPALNPAVAVPLLDLFTKKRIVYRHEPVTPPDAEDAKKSPLRFTWEYKNPSYYLGDGHREEDAAVAVISGAPYAALPKDVEERMKGYRLSGEFDGYEGIFAHRTVITVYQPVAERRHLKDARALFSMFE
jgi:hypothetical protein